LIEANRLVIKDLERRKEGAAAAVVSDKGAMRAENGLRVHF
jgi:hypothetical protein